jgi:hypothetical protein
MLEYCFKDILRNTDFGILSEGLFMNYLTLKSCERNMFEAVKFLV